MPYEDSADNVLRIYEVEIARVRHSGRLIFCFTESALAKSGGEQFLDTLLGQFTEIGLRTVQLAPDETLSVLEQRRAAFRTPRPPHTREMCLICDTDMQRLNVALRDDSDAFGILLPDVAASETWREIIERDEELGITTLREAMFGDCAGGRPRCRLLILNSWVPLTERLMERSAI